MSTIVQAKKMLQGRVEYVNPNDDMGEEAVSALCLEIAKYFLGPFGWKLWRNYKRCRKGGWVRRYYLRIREERYYWPSTT